MFALHRWKCVWVAGSLFSAIETRRSQFHNAASSGKHSDSQRHGWPQSFWVLCSVDEMKALPLGYLPKWWLYVLVAIATPCSISAKDWFLFYRSTSQPPFTSMWPTGLDGLISELVPGNGVKLFCLGKREGKKGEKKKEQRESREKAERKW